MLHYRHKSLSLNGTRTLAISAFWLNYDMIRCKPPQSVSEKSKHFICPWIGTLYLALPHCDLRQWSLYCLFVCLWGRNGLPLLAILPESFGPSSRILPDIMYSLARQEDWNKGMHYSHSGPGLWLCRYVPRLYRGLCESWEVFYAHHLRIQTSSMCIYVEDLSGSLYCKCILHMNCHNRVFCQSYILKAMTVYYRKNSSSKPHDFRIK